MRDACEKTTQQPPPDDIAARRAAARQNAPRRQLAVVAQRPPRQQSAAPKQYVAPPQKPASEWETVLRSHPYLSDTVRGNEIIWMQACVEAGIGYIPPPEDLSEHNDIRAQRRTAMGKKLQERGHACPKNLSRGGNEKKQFEAEVMRQRKKRRVALKTHRPTESMEELVQQNGHIPASTWQTWSGAPTTYYRAYKTAQTSKFSPDNPRHFALIAALLSPANTSEMEKDLLLANQLWEESKRAVVSSVSLDLAPERRQALLEAEKKCLELQRGTYQPYLDAFPKLESNMMHPMVQGPNPTAQQE